MLQPVLFSLYQCGVWTIVDDVHWTNYDFQVCSRNNWNWHIGWHPKADNKGDEEDEDRVAAEDEEDGGDGDDEQDGGEGRKWGAPADLDFPTTTSSSSSSTAPTTCSALLLQSDALVHCFVFYSAGSKCSIGCTAVQAESGELRLDSAQHANAPWDSSKTWPVLTAGLSYTFDRTHAKFYWTKNTSSTWNYCWRNEYWWGTIWVEWTLCPAAWVDLVPDWQWWKYKWACPTHHTFDFFIQVKC